MLHPEINWLPLGCPDLMGGTRPGESGRCGWVTFLNNPLELPVVAGAESDSVGILFGCGVDISNRDLSYARYCGCGTGDFLWLFTASTRFEMVAVDSDLLRRFLSGQASITLAGLYRYYYHYTGGWPGTSEFLEDHNGTVTLTVVVGP